MVNRPPDFNAQQSLTPEQQANALANYYFTLSDFAIKEVMATQKVVDAQDEHIHYLEEQTMTDPLMGISNRRKLESTYQRLVTEHPVRRKIEPIQAAESEHSVIMIDVDRFKSINDEYGHGFGDSVLRKVAGSVQGSVRDRDEAGRYGGEEIVILLGRTTVDEAAIVAEKIRASIQETAMNDEGLYVTASFGVALLEHGADLSEGVRNADVALYAAKEGGRNQVQIYDPSMRQPESR